MTKQIALLASVLMAVFAAPSWGQQKQQIVMSSEGVKSRYVQQQAIDVDDVAGHQVRVQETHREYPWDKQLVVEGERVVESWIRGFSNYVSGIGPAWGYATWITDKGSKVFIEYSGTSESQTTDTGSRRGTYHGTARIVGGTGKFAKMRGLMVDTAKFDTDPSGL